MSQTFTTLWTATQVGRLRRAGLEGMPLSVTFGGPHLSAPSFRRAGVQTGDTILPIQVRHGRLHLLGGLRVAEILDVEEYVVRNPEQFSAVHDHPEFQRLERHLDTRSSRAFWLLRLWLSSHPDIDALCPGEATEVVLPAEAAVIRLDRVVPTEVVSAMRWQSGRRPERGIKHLSGEGRIERSISLQGIYRLTSASAEALKSLL